MIAKLLLMGILTFPQVSVAIGHVESNFKVTAVGDNGKSKGAFQVQSRYWGPVPTTLREQMEQHNDVLLELYYECGGDLPLAVTRYNGQGKKARRYLLEVTQETLERELLGEV